MAKLLAGSMRLTKRFGNCLAPSSFLIESSSSLNSTPKRLLTRGTTQKDACRGSGPKSNEPACGPPPAASSPKNFCASPPKSSSCNDSPITTTPASCTPTPPTDPCKPPAATIASSRLDNPCARECKISHPNPCGEEPPKPDECPETLSDICPPCEEDIQKMNMFKRICLIGVVPLIIVSSIILWRKADEDRRHPRAPYVPYEYMYRRTKKLPWGDGNHTLFHNPEVNAVPPDGYEVEDPYAESSK